MKNIEKINGLLADVQKLESLLIENKRTDEYTISFFSQAFDVTHNLLVQLQAIETEQLEAFRLQLESHQSIIDAIKLKGTIEEETIPSEEIFIKHKVEEEIIVTETAEKEEIIFEQEVVVNIEHDSQKPFFHDLETIHTIDSFVNVIVDNPVDKSVENTVKNTVDNNKMIRPDLRKRFTLLDLFYFRRELFKGDDELMNKSINTLNKLDSLSDAITYIQEELAWNIELDAAKRFIKLLQTQFASIASN